MTLREALAGKDIPKEIKKSLVLLHLPHFSFEREVRKGHLVIHADLAEETETIFIKLVELRFPIEQIIPVAAFDWDDDASMAANNTSAFNYRANYANPDKISMHALGRAIDINPYLNPFEHPDGNVYPVGAVYDHAQPGTITHTGEVVSLFKDYGWKWGGHWTDRKDWQHFEKSFS